MNYTPKRGMRVSNKNDLLFYRIEHWGGANGRAKNAERLFCDYLEPKIGFLLTEIGYKVKNVAREFVLDDGRIDFLVLTEDLRLVVVEVKHSNVVYNCDLVFSFTVGQVLTYRTILSVNYGVDLDRIDCVIITDIDSAILKLVLKSEVRRIRHIVVGKNEASVYGQAAHE